MGFEFRNQYLVKTRVIGYFMTELKDKINWFYVLLGAFFLIGYFYPDNTPVNDLDLKTKTVTLSRDIEYVSGHRSNNSFHRLWTNETQAAFKIEVPAGIAANWKPLDSLKRGDCLVIKYENARETDLRDGASEIPIYFLQKGERLIFDTTAYNIGKVVYAKRWGWIFLIGGALFILRGLTLVNSKTTWILGGISFAVILALRLFGKF